MAQILRPYELPEVNSERWLSRESLPGEEWRPAVGYEGLYEVSNYWRIFSLKKVVRSKHNSTQVKNERMMHCVNKCGYYGVQMSKNGMHRLESVHRVVALAFIPNPNDYPQVNHKDENKWNNCVNNLEWCTSKYNNSYGTLNKRRRLIFLNDERRSKPVLQYTMDNVFVAEYPSAAEASRVTGLSKSIIKNVCARRPNQYSAGGYKWKYKEDTTPIEDVPNPSRICKTKSGYKFSSNRI